MNKIKDIINNYFDRDFFWKDFENGSPKLVDIYKKSDEFEKDNPDLVEKILNVFQKEFPLNQISRVSPFVNEDRGLNFKILINESEKYFVSISIFGYFLACKLGEEIPISLKTYDDQGPDEFTVMRLKEAPFSPKTYIEQGDSELIDRVYTQVILPSIQVEWLPRLKAYEEIKEFNGGNDPRFTEEDEVFDEPIYVVNALIRI